MNRLLKLLLFNAALILICNFSALKSSAKDADGNIVVVIDPGHGGDDSGTQAVNGIYESHCNYIIAKAMKEELAGYSKIRVYLTREEDSWMTNMGRAMTAADLNADLLISIHNNSGSESSTGAMAFRTLNPYYSEAANDMCTLILDNLSTLGLYNGGVQTRTSTDYVYEDYYTLIAEGTRGGVLSIIVEHCFFSNPDDVALISNEDGSVNKDFLISMGKCDARAVASYFKLSENTAIADNNTSIELEKGYRVTLTTAEQPGEGVTWYSTNQKTASVDTEGNVTALESGTTNIVYKTDDGKEGSCVVTVNAPKELVLEGGINPTFYKTGEELNALNVSDVFAHIIYSDGTALRVIPDSVGHIDTEKVGIQDIEIKYGALTGRLRICHNSSEYIPSVTLPSNDETVSGNETSGTDDMYSQQESTSDEVINEEKESKGIFKDIMIYIIVIVFLVIIGIVIMIIEIRKKKRHRRNRSRKYI